MTEAPAQRRRRNGRPSYDLETVLQTAVLVFNERGYDGTSMEHLAHALGVSKSAIYYHVPGGKEELLRLALDRALDGLFAVIDEDAARTDSAIDRLEHVVRRSVDVLVEQLPFVTLLLRLQGNTETGRQAFERRRTFDHIVGDLVKQGVADGDLRPDVDPGLTSRLLFGMINSISDWYRPTRAGEAADIAEAVTKIAFGGLRRPGPRDTPVFPGSPE